MPRPERELISRIRKKARLPRSLRFSDGGVIGGVIVGIGDDASVLRIPNNREILVTTDFTLEGVHFRREWHPPESVGHRCLARGLSDIAAMGGEPIAAFLSLALPAQLPQRWVDGFLRGFLALANRFKVRLAGGDTAKSPDGILADVVVIGGVPNIPRSGKGGQSPRQIHGKLWDTSAVLRSGARPRDRIYVTGEIGASAATLDLLFSGKRKKVNPYEYPRHFCPEPRVAVGRFLRQKRIATSMIDLSDGLSTDLAHICEESGCGAEIQQNAVPCASIGKSRRKVDINFALHGGEDYELLFTAAPEIRVPSRIAGVQISEIGHMTRDRGEVLLHAGGSVQELLPLGWEHFRSK